MGAPKQKWTPEQEAALRAGVEKHGPGKWRTIQKDPEFASILATRSNVDLKDKWRNMNVGLGGHGSREKSSKSFPRYPAMKGAEDVSLMPSIHSGDISTEDTHGIADSLASSDSSKERKSLDPRYTDLIINGITELKDPNGSSTTAVAAYIEAHHPVPSNFRRLLSSKLRDMVSQGNLVKVKQNYKVRAAEPAFKYDGQSAQERNDSNQQTTETYQDAGLLANHGKNWKGEPAAKKVKLDAEFVRLKMKTAEEAARAAALAVAEAEAAAAAAEKAAKEAEVAEAEAEAAEMAAEVAAYYARRSSKKVCNSTFPVEDLAVAV